MGRGILTAGLALLLAGPASAESLRSQVERMEEAGKTRTIEVDPSHPTEDYRGLVMPFTHYTVRGHANAIARTKTGSARDLILAELRDGDDEPLTLKGRYARQNPRDPIGFELQTLEANINGERKVINFNPHQDYQDGGVQSSDIEVIYHGGPRLERQQSPMPRIPPGVGSYSNTSRGHNIETKTCSEGICVE